MIDKEDGGQWPQQSSKTSCSSLRSRKERQIHCPVWLPQLQTQRGPQVLLTPSLLLAALDQPRDLSGCGVLSNCTHHAARKKAKMWGQVMCQIHPEPLRHRDELPKLPILGVVGPPLAVPPGKGSVMSRGWGCQGLSRSPQSRSEAKGKRPVGQRDTAPCPCQQGLGRPKNWPHPGLCPLLSM